MLPEEIKVIRSPRRRRACIHVRPEGWVEVRVPQRFPDKKILKLLAENEQWILKKLTEVKNLQVPKKVFQAGEEFFVLGFPVTLCLTSRTKKIIFDGDAFFAPTSEANELRRKLIMWYRHKAEEVFIRRIKLYSLRMNLEPAGLKVKEYSARWGTCFPDGQIALNWRLIMAPLEVIDYVVVHELAHLQHNGHGRNFWVLVGKHLPDYKKRTSELENWGQELFSI